MRLLFITVILLPVLISSAEPTSPSTELPSESPVTSPSDPSSTVSPVNPSTGSPDPSPSSNPSPSNPTPSNPPTTNPPPSSPSFLRISLIRLSNPSGLLSNGSTCSEFAFAGTQCSLNLKVCTQLSDSSCDNLLDFGSISTGSNAIDMQEKEYNGQQNPIRIELTDGQFSGFTISAQLSHGALASTVDSFSQRIGGNSQPKGVTTITGDNGATLTLAWITDVLPSPSTTPSLTTESYSTTPIPTQDYTPTTTAVHMEKDCDEHTDRTNGVKTIYVQGSPLEVYCQYGTGKSGAYTTIQSRGDKNPEVTFNNTKEEYKGVIGEAGKGKNHWIGLNNMNKMTSGGDYGMMVELCCGGVGTQQKYLTFQVDDGPRYTLNATADLKSVGMDMKNTITGNKDIGQAFQTFETAGDDLREMCDILRYYGDGDTPIFDKTTGGWWFGGCGNNLNGLMPRLSNFNSSSPSTCYLDQTFHDGPGIELRTSPGTIQFSSDPADQRYFDGISYSRVRMSLFRSSNPPLGLSKDSFCTD